MGLFSAMRILVRTDGSFERGIGHISKQITLCDRLKKLNHEVFFVTRKNKVVENLLSQRGMRSIQMDGEVLSGIDEFIEMFKPDLIILDILNTNSEYISELKKHNVKIVTFDNADISAFDCDIIFNVMYYHEKEIKKLYAGDALYEGYRYVILDDAYNLINESKNTEVKRILVTQGGADTTNRTPLLLEILNPLNEETGIFFDIDVVIGPAFNKENAIRIEEISSKKKTIHVHRKPDNLAGLISCCDIAITAGGTTMWEIAACKRPMYVFINEAFEDETARLIKSLGFALYDGYSPNMETLRNNIKQLIIDAALRRTIVQKMNAFDIKNGVNRVVDKMYEHGVLK
jgi:spore coat polysaccharide biosynthesis predicted glycosyltransferase SpsG